jgi:hypothetical protein
MINLTKRFFTAKIIDFTIEFSVISFILNLLNLKISLLIEILLTFAFALVLFMIDHLFSKFSKVKTIGEAILGIKKCEGFSFKKISTHVAKDSSSIGEKITYGIIALFFAASPLISDFLIDRFGNTVTGLNYSNLKWKPFTHPEDAWKIEFPTKPKTQEKKIKLPDSNHLHLSEIVAEHDLLSYSIASAKLPDNLLKWSPNLILKGSIKILANNIKNVDYETDKIFKYQTHPTLPYTFAIDKKLIYGRLILIEDTLYKLEVECPIQEKDNQQEKLQKFFNSFDPQY